MTPPPVTPDMIEELAAAMWESKSSVAEPRTWATAGEMWQKAYLELAATAYGAVRRIDADQSQDWVSLGSKPSV